MLTGRSLLESMCANSQQTSCGEAATSSKPQILKAADLARVPWLVHGFTTRPGGFTTSYGGRTLNVGFTKDDLRASVERNRKQALLAAGAATKGNTVAVDHAAPGSFGHDSCCALAQAGSDCVLKLAKQARFTGDGVVTDLPRLALGILPPTVSLSCWSTQRRKLWARFMPDGAGR